MLRQRWESNPVLQVDERPIRQPAGCHGVLPLHTATGRNVQYVPKLVSLCDL